MDEIVYDRVKESFPTRRQTTRVSLGPPAQGDMNPQLAFMPLTQFWSKDETSLIQVGTHLLSINHLKPYPFWEKFLPIVTYGFNAYQEAVAPKGIRGISLRYVNKIDIPGTQVNLEDYFEFRPFVGPNLPQLHGPFMVAIQLPYENARDVLTLQLISITGTSIQNTLAISLDLTYSLVKPGEITADGVVNWMENAHHYIVEVFEASITDKLKKEFGEVPE
jgi:uncharacterized protein (TIGR04255 family)